jgi:hypothetical protein
MTCVVTGEELSGSVVIAEESRILSAIWAVPVSCAGGRAGQSLEATLRIG